MNFLNLEQLPFVGMSYQFHGEKQGAPFSAYFVNAKPGQGSPLHTHPYVEVEFTLEGTATMTVDDDTRKVNAGSIIVIPANTPHRFVNSGRRCPPANRYPRVAKIHSNKFMTHSCSTPYRLESRQTWLIQDRWQECSRWFVVQPFAHQSHWLRDS